MSLIRSALGLSLDTGQMWTFSIILSFAIFGILTIVCKIAKSKSIKTSESALSLAGLLYVITCVSIIAIWLILHFGFHAKFPSTSLDWFLGGSTPAATKNAPENPIAVGDEANVRGIAIKVITATVRADNSVEIHLNVRCTALPYLYDACELHDDEFQVIGTTGTMYEHGGLSASGIAEVGGRFTAVVSSPPINKGDRIVVFRYKQHYSDKEDRVFFAVP